MPNFSTFEPDYFVGQGQDYLQPKTRPGSKSLQLGLQSSRQARNPEFSTHIICNRLIPLYPNLMSAKVW
ncbi:hypothetical protein X888_5265 [Burkholderia pseudomallei MSHR4377]|nr:hypothetical protein BBK_4809 [Burkholderia pseudomallei NCTC 13179]KGV00489.1 hypothetical protein X888_5265 [Burkholderia pseudomallei MSHR4377]KGV22431.1 hypothetical protein X881_5058 [Burkholderia pseudomallei MSHR4300]KGX43738.1 hypothetical protein Y043_4444 [Burkholderia pseudomallei MSHR2138]